MTADGANGPTVRTLYLLRHCAPVQPAGGKRYLGQADPPLAPEGIQQAHRWRSWFRTIALSAVYCSDLQRARHTAAIIFTDHPLSIHPLGALREVHLGEWEGLPFAEVRRRDPIAYAERGRDPAAHRPPGGESFQDLRERVVPTFTRIVAETRGDIALVGHAGVLRVLLCHLLGLPLAHLFRIGQDPGGLSVVLARADGYRVQSVNIPPPCLDSGHRLVQI